jgi:FMN phosphatase YigB (HAD superfamily)
MGITKIQKILFVDFNGIISYDTYWKSLLEPSHPLHEYKAKIEEYLFKQNPDIIKQWMLGKYTSEDIHQMLHHKLGVQYEKLFEIFKKDCREIDISEKVLEKVKELKSEYYCILSTGNMDCFDRFILPSNPQLAETFDEIDNSYYLGILKTTNNGEYFSNKAQSLHVDLKDCVVIDDSAKVCSVFEELGGFAINVYGIDNVVAGLSRLQQK